MKLVVIDIDKGLGDAIKTQITPRKTAANLAVKLTNRVYCVFKTNVRP